VGDSCDPDLLVRLSLPQPRVQDGVLRANAIYIDRYGNVGLNVEHELLTELGLRLGEPIALGVGGAQFEANYVRTFAEVSPGELLVYEDAYRRLSLAVSRGSAAERLGLGVDDELAIRIG
jgi:S-adenosylmethionine hydrolase